MTPGRTRRLVGRRKLTPPEIPDGFIVRERLLRQLSANARVALVAAMPGYGKTVTVRQWVDTIEIPAAWLSLDLLDGEPLSFWSHFLLAVGSVLPGVDEEPAMLLEERGAEDRLFLAALLAELENSTDHVVVVLDGLAGHLDQATLDGLALLVDRAGQTLRLVITTRSNPHLPLARWRSVGWLNELREEQLSLTDDEALAMAEQFSPGLHRSDDILRLNHRVGGWPIGLHMALLSDPGAGNASTRASPDSSSDRMLADYLVSGVLEALTEEERHVALSLSVVKWFDPELCEDLVGAQAKDVVRHLLGRGVFLTVVDPRVGAMRFHALFRELMEMELGWRDPAGRIDLHRHAAMLWRARGDLTAAYHHLSAIGERSKAHELLIDPALELVDRGDLPALQQLARQLPTARDVDDANLALDLGLVAFYAEGALAATRWCDRAALLIDDATRAGQMTEAERHDVGLRLHDRRCAIALLDADLDGALTAIDARPVATARVGPLQVFERRFPIAAARVMLAARRREDADRWIRRAEGIARPEIVTAVTVPTLRAWHEWLFGRLDRATALIDAALDWIATHDIGPNHLAFDTLITGGWCRASAGDLDDAIRLAGRACADAETLACAWNHLQAGFLSARVHMITGDPVAALQTVDGLRSQVAFTTTCRTYADRIAGVEIEALAASGSGEDLDRLIEALRPGPRALLLRARFVASSPDEVEALLRDHVRWPVLECLQAAALLATRDDRSQPAGELESLVVRCAETGWVLPFLDLPPRAERLLRSLPLDRLHPRLAQTMAFIAPATPVRPPPAERVRLTSRELTLLELLPTHLSYTEMGERLYLSVNTVKSNLKSLYRKLDAGTRGQAVEAGRQRGLL